MNEARHTPGPWRVNPRGSDIWNIESEKTGEHIARVSSSMQPGGRFDDDARLIAAAPDLLSALEGCLRDMRSMRISNDCDPVNTYSMDAARAAIAKARGEA